MSLEEQILVAMNSIESSKFSEIQVGETNYTLKKIDNDTYTLSCSEKQLVTPEFHFLNYEQMGNGIKLTVPSVEECNSIAESFDDDSLTELSHLRTYSDNELLYRLSVGVLLQSNNKQ